MGKIIAFQHICIETMGLIAECLIDAGHRFEYVRLFDGEPVPKAVDDIDGIVIMGGPMGVYDSDRYRFLRNELQLIEMAIKESKPILGVCLGSQLIASALGSQVRKGDRKEIGWQPVSLNDSASEDCLWQNIPDTFMAYHWHGDVFDLPKGSVGLAFSKSAPCQAFRYGKKVYGILFHMEVDNVIVSRMVNQFRGELIGEGLDKKRIKQDTETYLPALKRIGREVFKGWASLIENPKNGGSSI